MREKSIESPRRSHSVMAGLVPAIPIFMALCLPDRDRRDKPGDDASPITRSQSQYRLRDDVLLNLIRTAVDRDFAPVEIMRRQGACPFGADRRLVPTIVVVGFLRQRIRADRLQQQFADGLLYFAALDLQDR